ncbi:MAG: ATP-binding cassette domain-containing protein, partial [Lachnospiraceae bacterium]|nr:ATP-binding cassette domain-containing protein [Lachnospiraceae bacterium]
MKKEKKLEVKDLTISFRTDDGKVQAVRDISFDLYKGETLAIVGESGSGKSVTSKTILGILAPNAIVESGEIIYDGKDLLKISEEDYCEIRGDKIAMIFQDPMSSLNPVVKIGRQLTEAMILKGKARQKESRKSFNKFLALLKENMVKAVANGDAAKAKELEEKCNKFNKFELKHLELQKKYATAREAADEAQFELDNVLFEIEKNALKDPKYRIKKICKQAVLSQHKYVVSKDTSDLLAAVADVKKGLSAAVKSKDYKEINPALKKINGILKKACELEMPNFFALGYFVAFSGKEVPEMEIPELNKYMRKYLDDNFMLDFIDNAKKAVIYSAEASYKEKEEAIAFLKKNRSIFEKPELDKKECRQALKEFSKEVMESVDKLEIIKDSLAYTFSTGFEADLKKYFGATKNNAKEEKRFARQTAKHEALIAKGKIPSYEVIPAAVIDLETVRGDLLHQIDRLIAHYEKKLANRDKRNYDDETVAIIDYLKEKASNYVTKVTKSMAKKKAIKLMEEVGIPEPRRRFNQYPHEFSGGMRQRIVIAIALAADPDILICDETTTALDVTIQSQILELINEKKVARNLTVIFITHDLGVVANMADRVAVMYAGKIVETGTANEVFYEAAHPYTWALLSSMPDLDTNEKLEAIPGTPPNMIY